VAIEVAIGLLGARQQFDGSLHDCFEFRVFPMLQIGARCLKPFGNIRVPEDAAAPIPVARLLSAPVHSLVETQGIQMPLIPHFLVDVAKSDLSYLLLQLIPKAAGNKNLRLIERLPWGKHA
jgi:hypothetical protein